jgi:hypothetical protein
MIMNKRLYTILSISCTLVLFTASALNARPINAVFRDDEGNYYDADRNLIVAEQPKPAVFRDDEGNYYDADRNLIVAKQPKPSAAPSENTFNNTNTTRNKNKSHKKEEPLVYQSSVYDSQGPRQGKMAMGGIISQIAANMLGNIGVVNKNPAMVTAAYGLRGVGEAVSYANNTRDSWGRFPGTPEYGLNPRNTNPQQYYPQNVNENPYGGQNYPYGGNNTYNNQPYQKDNFVPQNNMVQPTVNPALNRVPGTIRAQNLPVQRPSVPVNVPTEQKIQDAAQEKGKTQKKAGTTV